MTKYFLVFSVAVMCLLSFTGCKKNEGCVDSSASNYDPDADKDDGSCKYKGDIVFWYDQSTAEFLQGDDAVSLTYYVDNNIVGSSAASVYFVSPPACGQNASITVTKDLGTNKSKSYSYKVVDQSGWEYWSGTVTFEANTCIKVKLQ